MFYAAYCKPIAGAACKIAASAATGLLPAWIRMVLIVIIVVVVLITVITMVSIALLFAAVMLIHIHTAMIGIGASAQ